MLSWYITVKPLDTKSKNYLEMTNEFLILILGYFGFLFTDYVADPVLRYRFGYFYIGLLATGLLINIVNLGYTTVIDLKKHWKYYRQQLAQALSRKKTEETTKQVPKVSSEPVVKKSIFLRLMEGEQLSQSISSSSEFSSSSQSVEQSSSELKQSISEKDQSGSSNSESSEVSVSKSDEEEQKMPENLQRWVAEKEAD